jgi:glycosyltransferase involved in cell wall biosynthesis
MRLLFVAFYFPPAAGAGVQRPLKLTAGLAARGVEVTVLTPRDPRWIHRDESLPVPPGVEVIRTAYPGPRGRRPAEELYALTGLRRLARAATLQPRRLLVPDEHSPWLLTALPRALQLERGRRFDAVVTTSPPASAHLIGAALRRATGLPWIADLRDSLVAKSDRALERRAVRLKEGTSAIVAELVARRADAVVAVTETIAAEIRRRRQDAPVTVVPNGIDLDEARGLAYRNGGRFRLTHTGSFFGPRDPRPILEAIARLPGELDLVARFVGDFRAADLAYARELGVDDRIELLGYRTRRETLALQRDSEALLLLLPEIGERGLDVPSAKLFEYLAARRPILAAVPPAGTAARIVNEAGAGTVVAPDDAGALTTALADLAGRWREHGLPDVALPPATLDEWGRETQVARFAELLEQVARR